MYCIGLNAPANCKEMCYTENYGIWSLNYYMTEECLKDKEFFLDDENEIKWINIYK